jgi:hypothetical protein
MDETAGDIKAASQEFLTGSYDRGDILMPIDTRASRVLAFSVLFLSVATYSSGQAGPPVPAKGTQSAGSSVVSAPLPDVSK